MGHQPEAILEEQLIRQLAGIGYTHIHIADEEGILSNLKSQLELFNRTTLTPGEFDDVFKCLETRPSVLKAKEIGEHIIDRMKAYVEVFIRVVED